MIYKSKITIDSAREKGFILLSIRDDIRDRKNKIIQYQKGNRIIEFCGNDVPMIRSNVTKSIIGLCKYWEDFDGEDSTEKEVQPILNSD